MFRQIEPRNATPPERNAEHVPVMPLYRVAYIFNGEVTELWSFYTCHAMALLNAWIVSTTYHVSTRVIEYKANLH